MKSDEEIEQIIANHEMDAIGYCGVNSKVQQNRAMLLERYNRQLFGDEIDGQSKVVTSDVFDVVEGALPNLIRLFTQTRQIATFKATSPEAEEEAKQKTLFANYVFQQQHKPLHLLMSLFKDALLQYTGTLETYWDDKEEYVEGENYFNINQFAAQKLQSDPNYSITEVEDLGGEFNVKGVRTNKTGRIKIQPIPPNEVLISKRAKDFKRPPFYGKNTAKTRSELLQMGFNKEIVMNLGSEQPKDDEVDTARFYDSSPVNRNPTEDKSQDVFRLGEYYLDMDVDGDGIAEYWKVFFITDENKLLEKQMVDNHSLATVTPIPMPHRAIGECLASLVADHQYWHSTLVRNLNNNIYATNFSRVIINDRVDDDEVYTPVPGGVIHVEGNAPVTGSIEPLVTVPQSDKIIQAIELAETQKEKRTGITAYNQGMDTEALNKTATGFTGIRDMSQMRMELVARVLAEGLQMVFERIIELASKYHNTPLEIMVLGEPLSIDPTMWKYKADCTVSVGVGGGERQEQIQNLNYILELQRLLAESGSILVDEEKMYNTLNKLLEQSGLFGAEGYFNDPSRPEELLMSENEQLKKMVENMTMQIEQLEPLQNSEKIRAEANITQKQIDSQTKIAQEQIKSQIKVAEIDQKERHHDDDVMVELTKIEADTGKDVEGSAI